MCANFRGILLRMKVLGYRKTWQTRCFIEPERCGKLIWGHTNGNGDFVLLERLGYPWEVHSCYFNRIPSALGRTAPSRFLRTAEDVSALLDRLANAGDISAFLAQLADTYFEQQTSVKPTPPRNISRFEPRDLGGKKITIAGYVQSYLERKAPSLIRDLGALAQQIVMKKIGSRLSQITIIDSDLRSFTCFADLRQVVLSEGSLISAELTAAYVPLMKKTPYVFLADEVHVLELRPKRWN